MQENLKQVKRSKTLSIFAICLFLVFFTVSVFLAVIAPIFTSNGVASAVESTLPDNGRVGDNILTNSSDFSKSPWNRSGSSLVSGNQFIANSDWGSISYPLGSSYNEKVVTCTVRVRRVSGSGSVALNLRYFSSGSSSSTGLSVVSTVSSNFVILTVSYDLSLYNASSFHFVIYGSKAGTTFEIDWAKFELGSSFTGYVPNYQNQINDLQNQLNQANNDKEELQAQYNKLLDSMDFSTFNSVDLNSTRPLIASTTMGNSIGSSSTAASYNGVSYGGYWYYRNSVESDPYSFGLAEFDIGSTLLAGSDIKISYDALFPYNGSFADNVGVVLTFSNFGVYSSASNMKVSSVFIPASDFISKELIYNFDFDVNYITFGVGTFDSSSNTFNDITLGYDINSSVKQGVFISNFVVKGRGSNFSVAIDNANKQGYNKGYQEGKVAGKTIGYQQGVKDQGDYTFMGLLGAVFDAPINAFKGLLNFEILGVDMTAFVSSLFALAIIVVIIKISLGGK